MSPLNLATCQTWQSRVASRRAFMKRPKPQTRSTSKARARYTCRETPRTRPFRNGRPPIDSVTLGKTKKGHIFTCRRPKECPSPSLTLSSSLFWVGAHSGLYGAYEADALEACLQVTQSSRVGRTPRLLPDVRAALPRLKAPLVALACSGGQQVRPADACRGHEAGQRGGPQLRHPLHRDECQDAYGRGRRLLHPRARDTQGREFPRTPSLVFLRLSRTLSAHLVSFCSTLERIAGIAASCPGRSEPSRTVWRHSLPTWCFFVFF